MVKWAGPSLMFVVKNFAVPIAFLITFRLYGAKPAIALAVGVSVVQSLTHWVTQTRPSPFFVVSAFFTIVLGAIDLFVTSPRFYRLEAGVQNFVMSAVFLISVWIKRPIAAWFATALPGWARPQLDSSMSQYLQNITLIWGVYFFVKGAVFLYLSLTVDLGELIVWRSLLGGGTLILMFGGEFIYRKRIWITAHQV